MEIVNSNADTSIQPLVERLAIGSAAGRSASLLINDSRGSGASATMIFPPRILCATSVFSVSPWLLILGLHKPRRLHREDLYVEPWSYPYILNRQRQTQNQLDRQCQQHTHREELESQVLKQTRSRKKFLFECILRKEGFMKSCQTK